MKWPINLIAVCLLLIGGLFAVRAFISKPTLSALRGDLLYVEPSTTIITDAKVGETVRSTFMLTNVTDKKIRVLGANSTCGCTGIVGLPINLESGETRDVEIRMEVGNPSVDGVYSQSATLLLDCKGPKVSLILEANVSP
jgi:hypothetical protein